ncbi:hypothetical protein BGW38_009658, partial [Lunasporangiospora selenospora]
MQNVNVQYNPNANPFDDDPPIRQDAPLLLSAGYASSPAITPGYVPHSPYTPYQQPSMPVPQPSPHVPPHNPFGSTHDLPPQQPHVQFDGSSAIPGTPALGGSLPPGTPDTRHYGPAPTAQKRRYPRETELFIVMTMYN